MPNLLIIDDSEFDRDGLARLASRGGAFDNIATAQDRRTALDMLEAFQPDLIILDDYLGPVQRAPENIRHLRGAGYKGLICVASGAFDSNNRPEIARVPGVFYFDKDDFDDRRLSEMNQLIDSVEKVWRM